MEDTEIARMEKMEHTYWWHQGKRCLIRSFLDKYYKNRQGRILDFGCGTGETLRLLADYGPAEGADTSAAAVSFCHAKGLQNVYQLPAGQVPAGPYSLITSFDVLEHIRDDIGILDQFYTSLEANGMLLVSVPACRFLWSEHDEALEHVRRYVYSELRAKLTMAGFDVIRITYAVSIVFFPNLLYRFICSIFPKPHTRPKIAYVNLPKPINTLLYLTLVLESKIIKHVNQLCGCSLFALARKKGK